MLNLKFHNVALLSVFLFITVILHAQQWPKIYGDSFHSLSNNIIETYDNAFVINAFTYEPYGFNKYIWVLKIDINGNVLWEKKIGDGVLQYWSSNSHITSDNGFIISGASTRYSSGDFDPLFIKMDVCGEIEWCRVLISADQNYGVGVFQQYDGSYIGLLQYYGEGAEYSRFSLIKMDQTGVPIWISQLAQEDSLISNEDMDYLYMTSDNNYLVSGSCFHPGFKPFWIKTDTTGSQLWDLMWQGGMGTAYQVVESSFNNFYSIGTFAGSGMPFTPTLFKFDYLGNEIYQEYILGDTIDGGEAKSICLLNDSTILAGVIWGSLPLSNVIYSSELFKMDTLGNLLDRRLLLNEDKAPKCIIESTDGKILVIGYYVVDNNFDIYLWKMNQDLEDDTLYTQPMTYDSLCPYPITSDTVDLNCSLFVNIDEIPTKEEYESTIKISPNPATEWVTLSFPDNLASGWVELSIYDLLGREVLSRNIYPENRLVSLYVSDLPSGIYLIMAHDSRNQVMKGKFIVSR